jgi:hypothetical protein
MCGVSRMLCITWYAGKAGQPVGTPTSRPQTPRAPAERRDPGPVTTPEERRQLRERLAAEGDPATRKFLHNLDAGEGGTS